MAGKPQVETVQTPERLRVGEDLFVVVVQGSALKEQDINAQVMQPAQFDRLTENIRKRGSLESLPYCHQPGGKGPISVVSGHHRARAARQAGLTNFPVLVDTREMTLSEVRAKQIAHNELHGSPDEEILRRMIAQIESVDDLLMSGLPEDYLPPAEEVPSTALLLPHAEFDWKMLTLTFLPKQMADFEDAVKTIESSSYMVGVAPAEMFEEFSKAMLAYSKVRNIKSMATVVATLTEIAKREVEAATGGEPATETA